MSALPDHGESRSYGDFESTPEIDARLTAMARRARIDGHTRDELYAALGYKIERFVRRYRYRNDRLVICEPEDVAQEAYLVFCNLLDSWPGEESFSGYFFSRFPWRLARAVDVAERGWSASRLLPLLETDDIIPPLDPEDHFTLIEIGVMLDERHRQVLELHIGHALKLSEIARILGVHRRTVERYWARIKEDVRIAWMEPDRPRDPEPKPGRPKKHTSAHRERRK
ncbi:MAG: sigma-70 family RNA polymerase sigma factor [Sphaerobacteraceae bacterium]|nr:MAG: sigma-70 family RNA polymerase sigma factor [Sphaerobacteraceae bacterium]